MALDDVLSFEIAVILIILIAVVGFLVPSIFVEQESPDTLTVEQSENERVALTTGLDAILQTVETGGNEHINVSLIDTQNGNTESVVLTTGESVTVTISGESVTITNQLILSPTEAVIDYSYPTYYGWPSGMQNLFQFYAGAIVILLAAFIWFLITLERGKANGY